MCSLHFPVLTTHSPSRYLRTKKVRTILLAKNGENSIDEMNLTERKNDIIEEITLIEFLCICDPK